MTTLLAAITAPIGDWWTTSDAWTRGLCVAVVVAISGVAALTAGGGHR